MNRIKCFVLNYTCSCCGFERSYSERIGCIVKKCHCEHFDVVVISVCTQYFKLKISFKCNFCDKITDFELGIGKFFNGTLKTEDFCDYACCGNPISLYAFLCEEYFQINNLNGVANSNNNNYSHYSQPQVNIINEVDNANVNHDYNPAGNYNNLDNNIIAINGVNINNNIEEEEETIVDFTKKNWKLVFEDKRRGNEGKKYEIYTAPNIKFKNIINSLKEENPEVVFNPETHSLLINGNILSLETSCNQNNIPSNSSISIILKNSNNIFSGSY